VAQHVDSVAVRGENEEYVPPRIRSDSEPTSKWDKYQLFLEGLVVTNNITAKQQEALSKFRTSYNISDDDHKLVLDRMGLSLDAFNSMKFSEEQSLADLCKICYENVIDCVLLPCGHLVSCVHCSKNLQQCPVDRSKIRETKIVFRS